MTLFQRKVLAAIADHENEGLIEVGLQLYGYPTSIEMHNLKRAALKLDRCGYVDLRNPTLTDKGRAALVEDDPKGG